MPRDVDAYLIDRVFQPATDAMAEWISCFTLARWSVVGAVLLEAIAWAWKLSAEDDPLVHMVMLAGGVITLCYVAREVRRQIARTERRARPGMLNVARITLRPLRMVFNGVAVVALGYSVLSGMQPVNLCNLTACALWVVTVYFLCCVPSPPRQVSRSVRGFAHAGAF